MNENRILALITLMRPKQQIKNVLIFFPMFFGGKLTDCTALFSCLLAFVGFVFLSGSVYIFNDIRDAPYDRNHQVKKGRPIASGTITVRQAYLFLLPIVFIGLSIIVSFFDTKVILLVSAYLILNVLYSIRLKNIAIIDVTLIGIFFVIRILVGTLAADLAFSQWLIMMTFLLAIFLALSKRRDDLFRDGKKGVVRQNILGYSFEFVSLSMVVMASVLIVCYILFSLSNEAIERYHNRYLFVTTLWVLIGILRYLQITFVEGRTGSPTDVLLTDRFLQATISCWILNYAFILYLR